MTGEGGFRITDKRSSAGSVEAEPKGSEPQADKRADAEQAKAREQARREVSFTSFILSLSTSAMVQLGELADPTSGKREENLEAAKGLIDILGMLKEKTRGNLEREEDTLLEGLLYELRMKYLEKTKQIKL